MNHLHNKIMNIPVNNETLHSESGSPRDYKLGHRDARHAAAEIALKYDRYIEKLEGLADQLGDLISGIIDLPGIRKECGL